MNGEAEKADEVVAEEPRRSREQILREFKLALAIGDGSLLESDQDRARGVDPYDSPLGGRRPLGHGSPSGHDPYGRGAFTDHGHGSRDAHGDRAGTDRARRRR
jgi:hypothetical protein